MKARVHSIPRNEQTRLLDRVITVDFGARQLSIRAALDERDAHLVDVVEDDTSGSVVAVAETAFGFTLQALGATRVDAIERLGTLAVRP